MRIPPMALATRYCIGRGIELGAAAHNPFELPDCLKVAPCDGRQSLYPQDFDDFNRYVSEQMRISDEVAEVDLLGDFQSIDADDGVFDYVVSSHVIEHVPNVFAAYIESARVLRRDGIFFCIFPKRTASIHDAVRPLSTLEDMIEAYEQGVSMGNMPSEDWRGHYQVFSLQSMLRVVNYLNRHELCQWLVECVEETDSKGLNGHTLVLRKSDSLDPALWQDAALLNRTVNLWIGEGNLSEALFAVKVALSFDFFDAPRLYLASLLSCQLEQPLEGIEFLRQALTLDPENRQYRVDFMELTKTAYINAVQ